MKTENPSYDAQVLLIGIGGVYNYGCEAIIRGTEKILHSKFPGIKIVYASCRVEDDSQRLENSKVQVVERGRFRRYAAKNIYRKLLSLAGIKWSPMEGSLALLNNINIVLSIGGDIYTLKPNAHYSLAFPKFGDAAEKQGVPYVLWGASVGPFTSNPKAEKAFAKHLKGISLITAREAATIEYLKTLGICENIVSCADPAYVVASEITANQIHHGDKFTIGINLSPLSFQYTNCSEKEAIYAQAKTIERLIKAFDANILLTPHVVCDFNSADDDLRYLRKVKYAISPENQGKISLVESDPGFVEVKKKLIKCDLVVAARMHCAINALAAHVPTILLSYSRKAIGMCQYVYGGDDWVLPMNDFTAEGMIEKKVRAIKNNNQQIRGYLKQRIPEIQKDAYRPMAWLEKLFDENVLDTK